MLNSLDPDRIRRYDWFDQDTKCFQRLSAIDNTCRKSKCVAKKGGQNEACVDKWRIQRGFSEFARTAPSPHF